MTRIIIPKHADTHKPGSSDPIPGLAPAMEERITGSSTSGSSGSDFPLNWAHDDGDTLLDYTDPLHPTVLTEGEYTLTLPIAWDADISITGFTWKTYLLIDQGLASERVLAEFSAQFVGPVGGFIREGVVTLSWTGFLSAGQDVSVFVHQDYSTDQAFHIAAGTLVKNGMGAGPRGLSGAAGIDGTDGADGAAGADGGIKYTYLTDTASSDPGSGKLKFDSATLSAITSLRISETDGDSNGLAALLASLDDSTSTVRTTVTMVKAGAPSNILVFQITSAVTDNGSWDGFTVAYVASSGSFANNDVVRLFFARTGDKGDTGSAGGTGAGSSELVYRYTVAGSDKASIDTGADTPDAGSNDWTNGDLLEVVVLARTDEAAADVNIACTVNNDTSSIYDLQNIAGNNASASASSVLAAARWVLEVHGNGGSASYPGVVHITMPGYAQTTFWKTATSVHGQLDATAGNNVTDARALGYRSTSAITRLKIAGLSTAKLKVGSQLLIYKRLAS